MQRTAPTAPSEQPTPFPDQHRAALAACIAARDEAQQRHSALKAAQHRANDERRAADDRVREAEAALRLVKANHSTRLAYQYLNRETVSVNAIPDAEGEVDRAKADLHHAEQIEEALAREIHDVELQLHHRHTAVKAALAVVTTGSAEFEALFTERDKAWDRLRTLCVLFGEIATTMDGYMPADARRRFLATEPLEKDRGYGEGQRIVPYEWDRELVQVWQEALSELQRDANAPLPGGDEKPSAAPPGQVNPRCPN